MLDREIKSIEDITLFKVSQSKILEADLTLNRLQSFLT
jgi:hypothetical protein